MTAPTGVRESINFNTRLSEKMTFKLPIPQNSTAKQITNNDEAIPAEILTIKINQ